jgi:hypothetical protein
MQPVLARRSKQQRILHLEFCGKVDTITLVLLQARVHVQLLVFLAVSGLHTL